MVILSFLILSWKQSFFFNFYSPAASRLKLSNSALGKMSKWSLVFPRCEGMLMNGRRSSKSTVGQAADGPRGLGLACILASLVLGEGLTGLGLFFFFRAPKLLGSNGGETAHRDGGANFSERPDYGVLDAAKARAMTAAQANATKVRFNRLLPRGFVSANTRTSGSAHGKTM